MGLLSLGSFEGDLVVVFRSCLLLKHDGCNPATEVIVSAPELFVYVTAIGVTVCGHAMRSMCFT